MGKYLNALKEREFEVNEISENYILEDENEKVFVDIPTLTPLQKVQKLGNSTYIPTFTHPQKVHNLPKAPDVAALSDAIERARCRDWIKPTVELMAIWREFESYHGRPINSQELTAMASTEK